MPRVLKIAWSLQIALCALVCLACAGPGTGPSSGLVTLPGRVQDYQTQAAVAGLGVQFVSRLDVTMERQGR